MATRSLAVVPEGPDFLPPPVVALGLSSLDKSTWCGKKGAGKG